MVKRAGKAYFYIVLVIAAAAAANWYLYPRPIKETLDYQPETELDNKAGEVRPAYVNLEAPYINEAPDGNWTGSWKNACEEAVIAMVENYYKGNKTVSVADAKAYMQTLFTAQQKTYGSDANSDAKRTKEIIDNHASFGATIVENPTLEDIKKELVEGRPVIAFHNGFALQNKNIPLLPTGSGYHTTVIKGYDDNSNVFIVHDDGDAKEGPDHLYNYDLLMNSLHDYQYATHKADGPPRALFTSSKS